MQVVPFVYADGSNEPPILLRDVPEQNYLDCSTRAFGLSLMMIALLFVFLATIWIVRHRTHNVVIAAQPPFLYAVRSCSINCYCPFVLHRVSPHHQDFLPTALPGICYHIIEYILQEPG